MRYLAEGMKYLPNNLNSVRLNLSRNNLGGGGGGNPQSLKWLGDCLKFNSKCYLKSLVLYLFDNYLGRNAENLKWVQDGMK